MYYYCPANDIVIRASSLKDARGQAARKLSPKYGFAPGRADSLKLARVSDQRGEDLRWTAIDWT